MPEPSSTRRTVLKTIGLGAATLAIPGASSEAARSPAGRRPIVLFFFPDQQRFDWVGLTPGLGVRTPHLDALAGRGVRFTNAVCPSPLCAPSRAALAAGKEYDGCGVRDNGQNYPVEQTTFYTLLRRSGYRVLGCGKFDLRKPARSWGRDGKQRVAGKDYLDLWGFSDGIDNGGKLDGVGAYRKGNACPYLAFLESRGLADVHVDDFKNRHNYRGTHPTALPDDAYVDNWIAENGLTLLRGVPRGKPWFLQVNFNGPHDPMDVTKRMKERWAGVRFPAPNGSREIPPEKHSEIRQNYSAMVENIDRWLGVCVEELERRGELDNTLIVYSSDHGEMLGDHDRWTKNVPYQPSVGVPFVTAGPGVRRGGVEEGPATTLDLAATFLDYAGLSVPAEMDSRSLRPLLEGRPYEGRSVVLSGLNKWRMVFDGRYKLIRGFRPERKKKGTKKEEGDAQKRPSETLLFDLKEDPLENVNVAERFPEIVRRLAACLDAGATKTR